MTRIFVFLCLISLASCRPDSKTSVETASTDIAFKSVVAPVPFAGNWLSEDYLNQIQKHQSPRKAQEGSEDCFIRIPDKTLTSTSMAYNFHEAGPELVVLRKDTTFQLWEKQFDTLSRMAYPIELISADKIRLGSKTFIRLPIGTGTSQPAILEEILFKGRYTLKNTQNVEFKSNGEVTGLGTYKYYKPLLDYFDEGLQVDQVGLGEKQDSLQYFGFKFSGDHLDLYELKCKTRDETGKRCVEVDFGKKIYSLQKETQY